jgi:6,7-dimethyl-8-ribityllumazine synthase
MTRAGSLSNLVELDGTGLRIAILSARFNDHIVTALRDGARRGLARLGVADGDVLEAWVPGAFELPLAAQAIAETGKVDAVLCLGTVIKGDTPHFDYVCGEAARGIQNVQLATGVPVMFGVLTVNTEQQAIDRSGPGTDNKGDEAAVGAVEMALLLKCLRTTN